MNKSTLKCKVDTATYCIKNMRKRLIISTIEQEGNNLNLDNIVYGPENSFEVDAEKVMEEKNKKNIEILHVENDEDISNLIAITLSDIANVTQANTLEEAQNLIEAKLFNVIILDYVFPEGTSDKLIPIIKSGINKNSKIVLFSAYEDCKIISKHVDKILIKTNISFEKFKECIEQAIASSDKME